MSTPPTIAFIGAGNMASAIIQGLLTSGVESTRLRVADPVAEQRDRIAAMGVAAHADNNLAVADAQIVVLAVKPQLARDVVTALNLRAEQTLISIAAGISIASMHAWTNSTQAIVRCMPNTPALLNAGMSALCANAHCTSTQADEALRILQAVGETVWVNEEAQLDAVTAVSGSGPAYFFYLMEHMIAAGTSLGLPAPLATQLCVQTALGAARMAQAGQDDPATLRRNVTSPGGTTAAALEIFASADVAATIERALQAAADRSAALSKEFGEA